MKKYQTLKPEELKSINGGSGYDLGYFIGTIIRTGATIPIFLRR